MSATILQQWRNSPPAILVAGDGPFAIALASVVGTVSLPLERLRSLIDLEEDGGYDHVLCNLRRVFLVVSEMMSAAEALRCHEAVWELVQKLTRGGDEHDLAF